MGQVCKDDVMGGGGYPGVRLVSHGGDVGSPAVWVRVLGAVGRNYEYGGDHYVVFL